MKHSNKEAFYQRMRDLADVKGSLKEEKRTIGDLIDYKRGADNVNYGIVKENHHYYIKKSNSQGDKLGSHDFAYIDGLENITKYRFDRLSEADKQRNMILNTINEALGVTASVVKGNQSGKQSLTEEKKRSEKNVPGKKQDMDNDGDIDSADYMVKKDAAVEKAMKKDKKDDKKDKDDVDESVEEGAEEEIAAAEDKMKDAEMAAEMPEEEPEIPAEPEMGGEPEVDVDIDALDVPAEPEMGGEETPEMGAEPEMGGEETPEMDVDVDAGGEEPDGGEEEVGDDLGVNEFSEVESLVAKAGEKLMGMELNDGQIEDLTKTFLGYLKDGLGNIDVGERKKIAKKYLIDVEEEMEGAEADLQMSDVGSEESEMEEGQSCKECAFAKFAESKGYDVDSLMECGTEETANLVSSYMMEMEDQLSDEDFESMSVLVDDAVMESLVNEYGHDGLEENMKPFMEVNEQEANPEAKKKKIEGMFWWKTKPQEKKDTELKTLSEQELAEYAEMDDEALAELDEETINELNLAGLKNVGSFLGKKAGDAAQGVGQAVKGAAGAVKSAVTDKIDQATQKLDQLGNEITQQYQKGVKSTVEAKLNKAAEEFGEMVLKLDQASQKAGDGPINKQQLIMKLQGALKGTKKVAETVMGNDPAAVNVQPPLTEEENEEQEGGEGFEFGTDAETMGAAVAKPESPEMETEEVGGEKEIEIKDSTVNITMSESEQKLRKYVRARLQEKAGLRKPVMNENKKSKKVKMLDKMIDEQFGLFESVMDEAGFGKAITGAMGKASQMMGGEKSKQEKIKKKLPTLNSPEEIESFFYEIFGPSMNAGTMAYAKRSTPDAMLNILKQAAQDSGLGKVKIIGQEIGYEPVQHDKISGPSGFATGRSRLGM